MPSPSLELQVCLHCLSILVKRCQDDPIPRMPESMPRAPAPLRGLLAPSDPGSIGSWLLRHLAHSAHLSFGYWLFRLLAPLAPGSFGSWLLWPRAPLGSFGLLQAAPSSSFRRLLRAPSSGSFGLLRAPSGGSFRYPPQLSPRVFPSGFPLWLLLQAAPGIPLGLHHALACFAKD